MRSPSLIYLGEFVIYISCAGVILPLQLNYINVCIDIFLHHITVSEFICLCMLYYIIVGCTSSKVFFLSFSHVWVIILLCGYYICIFINIFVNIISMSTEIFLWTLFNILFGCTPYWEYCYKYFLYMIYYAI